MMKEHLILVDMNDNETGIMEKSAVHKSGLLHRAFSVFVFNSSGELLLQQRSDIKYHSSGLWTNTCCSHPRYDEKMEYAVKSRLKEEMGISCDLEFEFSFIYKSIFDNGLIEHEYDHVYFGVCDAIPNPKISEVKSWKYVNLDYLKYDITENPHLYSEWLKVCIDKILIHHKLYFLKNQFKDIVNA